MLESIDIADSGSFIASGGRSGSMCYMIRVPDFPATGSAAGNPGTYKRRLYGPGISTGTCRIYGTAILPGSNAIIFGGYKDRDASNNVFANVQDEFFIVKTTNLLILQTIRIIGISNAAGRDEITYSPFVIDPRGFLYWAGESNNGLCTHTSDVLIMKNHFDMDLDYGCGNFVMTRYNSAVGDVDNSPTGWRTSDIVTHSDSTGYFVGSFTSTRMNENFRSEATVAFTNTHTAYTYSSICTNHMWQGGEYDIVFYTG